MQISHLAALITLSLATGAALAQDNGAAPDGGNDTVHFGSAVPAARPDGAIRLASYNVLNLFDDQDDPKLYGRREDRDDTKPVIEREALAAAIRAIDADVIALQEVESRAAVEWFRDAYLKDMGYDHLESIDAGDQRGIENAVLSRFPLENARVWPKLALGGVHPEMWGSQVNYSAGEPLEFRRSPLRVTVFVPDADGGDPYRLTLFVVHHKSGFGGGYWREAEARKVVELARQIEREDPRANIVVLGDFNCRGGDEPMAVYREAGFLDAFQGKSDDDAKFVSHESGRRIDHILFNESSVPELVPDTRFIFGTPSRAPGEDWRTVPAPDGYASDHFPVVVDLVPNDEH